MSFNKNMTFKRRHNHPAKKGEFVADCQACELILQGHGGTGVSFGAGVEVNREWQQKRTSRA